MTKPDLNDTELEALFESARRAVPEPDPGFLNKLEQGAIRELAATPRTGHAGGFTFASLLGGWRGLGGLAMAGVTGLWIGVAPPSALPDPVDLIDQALNGTTSVYEPMFGVNDLEELLLEDADNV